MVGYDAATAMKAATVWAAEALGLEDRGVLAPGKLADIVVLRKNPLVDISALRSVDEVILGGEWAPGPGAREDEGTAVGRAPFLLPPTRRRGG